MSDLPKPGPPRKPTSPKQEKKPTKSYKRNKAEKPQRPVEKKQEAPQKSKDVSNEKPKYIRREYLTTRPFLDSEAMRALQKQLAEPKSDRVRTQKPNRSSRTQKEK